MRRSEIKGVENAEDIVVIPGTDWVVSGAISMEHLLAPKAFFINIKTRETRVAWPDNCVFDLDRERFGTVEPPTSAYSFHGIDVTQRGSVIELVVVNHALEHGPRIGEGRESIEVFEIDLTPGGPSLRWRGAVLGPAWLGGNDVCGLAEGGFAVTNFSYRGTETAKSSIAGAPSGNVLEWLGPDTGWAVVAGTDLNYPNGIAQAPGGDAYFVAAWGAKTLMRISRSDPYGSRVALPMPGLIDNITWTPDGALLLCCQQCEVAQLFGGSGGVPPTPFHAVRVDPVTLESRTLVNDVVDGFFATTVLQVSDKDVWVSSAFGDRMLAYEL